MSSPNVIFVQVFLVLSLKLQFQFEEVCISQQVSPPTSYRKWNVHIQEATFFYLGTSRAHVENLKGQASINSYTIPDGIVESEASPILISISNEALGRRRTSSFLEISSWRTRMRIPSSARKKKKKKIVLSIQMQRRKEKKKRWRDERELIEGEWKTGSNLTSSFFISRYLQYVKIPFKRDFNRVIPPSSPFKPFIESNSFRTNIFLVPPTLLFQRKHVLRRAERR